MNFKRGKQIAISGKDIIFLNDEITSDDDSNDSEESLNLSSIIDNLKRGQKICPLCDKRLSSKSALQKHIGAACCVSRFNDLSSKNKKNIKVLIKKQNMLSVNGKMKLFNNEFGKSEVILKGTGNFSIMPPLTGRDCIFLSGCSGSGKSTFICEYIKQIKKIFPNKKIILYSFIEEDSAFEEFKNDKNFIRMKLTDDLVENPIDIKKLAGTVCVFDDIISENDK
ncbi:hypothetical protein LCGC14_2246800, partial [marine sediment metagenome]